jgi:hypothetical protein
MEYGDEDAILSIGLFFGFHQQISKLSNFYAPSPEYSSRRRRIAGMIVLRLRSRPEGEANRAEAIESEGGLGCGAIPL